MTQNRQPPGRPTGGEYAPTIHAEPGISLAPNPQDQAALKRLEGIRDAMKGPEAKEIVQQLIDNPHRAAFALLKAATHLGANEEWESEMLDGVAEGFRGAGIPEVGDQTEEALRGYRELADQFGYEHDGPEDDEDERDTCPVCGEEGYASSDECLFCADQLEGADH